MKFVKEVPTTDGYYWIVDLEYPIPKIVWLGIQHHKAYWDWGREIPISEAICKFIRWGDKVVAPDGQSVEICY